MIFQRLAISSLTRLVIVPTPPQLDRLLLIEIAAFMLGILKACGSYLS